MTERISKNYELGVLIKNVYQLQELANNRQSVYHKSMKIKPASVIMSMQCRMVLSFMKHETLYTIVKIEKV